MIVKRACLPAELFVATDGNYLWCRLMHEVFSFDDVARGVASSSFVVTSDIANVVIVFLD